MVAFRYRLQLGGNLLLQHQKRKEKRIENRALTLSSIPCLASAALCSSTLAAACSSSMRTAAGTGSTIRSASPRASCARDETGRDERPDELAQGGGGSAGAERKKEALRPGRTVSRLPHRVEQHSRLRPKVALVVAGVAAGTDAVVARAAAPVEGRGLAKIAEQLHVPAGGLVGGEGAKAGGGGFGRLKGRGGGACMGRAWMGRAWGKGMDGKGMGGKGMDGKGMDPGA
eukprot:scaffold28152_cov86-Isochrysis_galbana.AAC.1